MLVQPHVRHSPHGQRGDRTVSRPKEAAHPGQSGPAHRRDQSSTKVRRAEGRFGFYSATMQTEAERADLAKKGASAESASGSSGAPPLGAS